MKNIMDIIERFQAHHALQEEREMENSHAPGNGTVAPRVPAKKSIFETEEVRVSTVAVPSNTEWSTPNNGRDRLVIVLGKIGQVPPRDGDPAFPARWTWIPANSDFKMPNKADQTRNLLIVELNDLEGELLPGDSEAPKKQRRS
jgi:hypothetical protein